MQKKLLTGLIAMTITLSFNSGVFADPNSENLSEKLKKVNQATESLQGNIESLDSQIETTQNQISENKAKVNDIQKNIKVAEQDIKNAQDKMDEEQQLYNGRIRALYISSNSHGTAGYIKILLSSKSISNFFTRVNTVKRLSDMDSKITNDLKKQKADIEKKKDALDKENNRVTALLNDNTQKLASLNSDHQKMVALADEEKKEANKYKAQIAAATESVSKISDSVPKYIPSRGATNISSNSIVAYAANFIGTPYVYGGNGPESFDCSGFTKYVFAHFGVGLNRVAADQARQGTSVSDLQPGDLVFFGSTLSTIHHVGIYVGNGCYIHAPHTGSTVQISPLDRSDFICARRVY